jgi:hypothetical protein
MVDGVGVGVGVKVVVQLVAGRETYAKMAGSQVQVAKLAGSDLLTFHVAAFLAPPSSAVRPPPAIFGRQWQKYLSLVGHDDMMNALQYK